MTLQEAATHFVTPAETIRTWAKRGHIETTTVAGVKIYNVQSIRDYEKTLRRDYPGHLSSRRRRAEDLWRGL